MKKMILLFALLSFQFAKADYPFSISCSDEYLCDLPGASKCAPSILKLEGTWTGGRQVQASVLELQVSGVYKDVTNLPAPAVGDGTLSESGGQTTMNLMDRNGNVMLSLRMDYPLQKKLSEQTYEHAWSSPEFASSLSGSVIYSNPTFRCKITNTL